MVINSFCNDFQKSFYTNGLDDWKGSTFCIPYAVGRHTEAVLPSIVAHVVNVPVAMLIGVVRVVMGIAIAFFGTIYACFNSFKEKEISPHIMKWALKGFAQVVRGALEASYIGAALLYGLQGDPLLREATDLS